MKKDLTEAVTVNEVQEPSEAVTDSEAQSVNDEQAASAARLDAIIPDASEAAKDEAAINPVNTTENLYGLLSLIPIGLTFTGLKNTAAVWSDDVCRGVATKAVPVLQKYSWGQKIITFLDTGGGLEEMALAAVLFPVGMATYNAINMDAKVKELENKKPKQTESEQLPVIDKEFMEYDAKN